MDTQPDLAVVDILSAQDLIEPDRNLEEGAGHGHHIIVVFLPPVQLHLDFEAVGKPRVREQKLGPTTTPA